MSRPALTVAAAIVALAGAAVAAVALTGAATPAPRAAAERFLDDYVEPDGRVVRRDQGGDTVSEGQAYALLLAVAAGDAERFARVWGWTRSHLQRRDGLLAWRWAGGRVADREPAADADLDAARALVLAARRFRHPAYRSAGRRIGTAVLRLETVRSGGDPVLSPGPWARAPRLLAPSYFSPRAYALLGGRREPGWQGLAASSRRLAGKLAGAGLPPDWARLEPYGVVATGTPRGDAGPRYGFDAVRMPIRFAESCSAADRSLAARQWARLRTSPGAVPRALDGRAQGGEHAAAFAGSAAAAWAAGDRRAADDLLDRAEAADRAHPTYYGAAWAALARTMLQTRALGGCPRITAR